MDYVYNFNLLNITSRCGHFVVTASIDPYRHLAMLCKVVILITYTKHTKHQNKRNSTENGQR
jgi:hypothetical protein